MQFLRDLLDNSVKPIFDKGGKLEKLYPAYDAIETFLFVPGHATHGGSHIRDYIDLKRTMITVIIALVPCLLFGIWNTGHQHYLALNQFTALGDGFIEKIIFGLITVLPIVVVSYGVGLTVEFAFAVIKGHQVNEGFLVTGMLIPLCLPVETPLWMIGIATAFAVLIGKEVFGGTGMNIWNPALTARAFLFFAYPTMMSGNKVWISLRYSDGIAPVDGFTGATALGELANYVGQGPGEPSAALFGPDATYSMANAFFGFIPGSVGETSALACLIGAGILLFTGIGSWRIMASMFVGGLTMGWIFNMVGANAFMSVNPLHQLLIGGFMFGMVFMATDPVSAAQTNMGKLIYGFFAGFLSIMIRVFNPAYPEGVMLAILFMNTMAPIIDHYVVQANINWRNKRAKLAVA